MKSTTTTRTYYTPQEIKSQFPNKYDAIFEKWQNEQYEHREWDESIVDSMKACFDNCNGISYQDYKIDADYPSSSYIKRIRFDYDEVAEFTGNRAIAWLENNLYSKLRIPFGYFSLSKKLRWNLSKYGQYYRAGMIKPCPFTGVCYDEDMIAALNKSIKDGDTLEEAFNNLAFVAAKLQEEEWEYNSSEECFLDCNDEILVDEEESEE